MDRKLAEALISPLSVGDTLARDWRLKQISVAEDRSFFEYTIGQSDLNIRITQRSDDHEFYQQTKNFNIAIRSDSNTSLTKSQHLLMNHMVTLFNRNDIEELPSFSDWTSDVQDSTFHDSPRSRLYLVPGYIGNPDDISLRAFTLLQKLRHIFIEDGKEELATKLFTQWNLDPKQKNFINIKDIPKDRKTLVDQLETIIEAGEDCCFFGLDEGLPGFIDPGIGLLKVAQERLGKLEIRTVGGGGALSAALMRIMPQNQHQAFTFLGHMEESTVQVISSQLQRIDTSDNSKSYVFFTYGPSIKSHWEKFLFSVKHLDGDFHLLANLTCANEYARKLPIDRLSSFDASTIDDDDKIVIWLHPRVSALPKIEAELNRKTLMTIRRGIGTASWLLFKVRRLPLRIYRAIRRWF